MESTNVETFEHDIANEVRQKEASIVDIASSMGDLGDKKAGVEDDKKQNTLIYIVIVLVFCGLIGTGYVGYTYLNGDPSVISAQPTTEQKKLHPEVSLSSVSPIIENSVGKFLTNVEKSEDGYSISIISYSNVFSYMLRNESSFGDEIAKAVGNKHVLKTVATGTQEVTSTNSTSTNTIKVGTSTQSTGTSTKATSTIEIEQIIPEEYIFSDITISNQNMRVAVSKYGTVAYAFIGTQKLVISSSTEGILRLRSNILHK